jgi:hypothetical protein
LEQIGFKEDKMERSDFCSTTNVFFIHKSLYKHVFHYKRTVGK